MNRVEEIGKEMAKQKNFGTQYPLFALQEKVKRWVRDEYEDHDGAELEQACEEHEETGDIVEDCEECSWNYFVWETQYNLNPGIFLTEEAGLQHIKDNHYHYNEPSLYVVSAWRNYEMQLVMQHLIEQGGKKVPSHYA